MTAPYRTPADIEPVPPPVPLPTYCRSALTTPPGSCRRCGKWLPVRSVSEEHAFTPQWSVVFVCEITPIYHGCGYRWRETL